MLELDDRILLNNGMSIVDDKYATTLLLNNGEIPNHIKVLESRDSKLFKEKYNKDISSSGEEIEMAPDTTYDESDLKKIIDGISLPRDNTNSKLHNERLQKELDYFNNNNLNYIIVKMYSLIKQFKEDNVIWGVGRGSSCACYIFYLLEVHDINPIKFDIDFREFSKEES